MLEPALLTIKPNCQLDEVRHLLQQTRYKCVCETSWGKFRPQLIYRGSGSAHHGLLRRPKSSTTFLYFEISDWTKEANS